MNQFLTILKEHLIDKKWIILSLGAMIGGLALLVIGMIDEMDLEAFAAMPAYKDILDFMGGVDFQSLRFSINGSIYRNLDVSRYIHDFLHQFDDTKRNR